MADLVVSGLIWSLIYHKSVLSTITQMVLMIFRKYPSIVSQFIFFPHHQFVETKRSPPTTSNPFNQREKEANNPGDFILSSLAIALVLHTLSNRLLIPTSPNSQLSDSRVEYAYSFDVAVNSFFPAFLTIHLGLILMAGVLVRDNWVCLFVGKYV
jgi:hypothetical protein